MAEKKPLTINENPTIGHKVTMRIASNRLAELTECLEIYCFLFYCIVAAGQFTFIWQENMNYGS